MRPIDAVQFDKTGTTFTDRLCVTEPDFVPGIVGGVDADIADLPWQISMQTQNGFHFCGGTVLNAEWILTAGHCVDGTAANSIRTGTPTEAKTSPT